MNSSPKYSLDSLPGDGWEVRRTKQVARAIAREKAKHNLTTEALAERCSRFLGDADAVKASTLNGLFAGKRKSIGLAELEMFAAVLYVGVYDLLYPDGEMVERRPGVEISSADAVVQDAYFIFPAGGMDGGLMMWSRVERILGLAAAADAVKGAAVDAIGAMRRLGDISTTKMRVQDLQYRVSRLQNLRQSALAHLTTLPTMPPSVAWALEIDTDAITYAFLASIEPNFEGYAVGEYILGGNSGSAS